MRVFCIRPGSYLITKLGVPYEHVHLQTVLQLGLDIYRRLLPCRVLGRRFVGHQRRRLRQLAVFRLKPVLYRRRDG